MTHVNLSHNRRHACTLHYYTLNPPPYFYPMFFFFTIDTKCRKKGVHVLVILEKKKKKSACQSLQGHDDETRDKKLLRMLVHIGSKVDIARECTRFAAALTVPYNVRGDKSASTLHV